MTDVMMNKQTVKLPPIRELAVNFPVGYTYIPSPVSLSGSVSPTASSTPRDTSITYNPNAIPLQLPPPPPSAQPASIQQILPPMNLAMQRHHSAGSFPLPPPTALVPTGPASVSEAKPTSIHLPVQQQLIPQVTYVPVPAQLQPPAPPAPAAPPRQCQAPVPVQTPVQTQIQTQTQTPRHHQAQPQTQPRVQQTPNNIVTTHISPRKKRPRRKASEMVRLYACNYRSCSNSYGTLNHLNAHITFKRHGPKRKPEEFRQIRELYKLKKKMGEVHDGVDVKEIEEKVLGRSSELRDNEKENIEMLADLSGALVGASMRRGKTGGNDDNQGELEVLHQQRGFNGYGGYGHTLTTNELENTAK